MTKSLHVHLLPSLVAPEVFAGRAVVVIDVLRATTTIVHALASGATAVVPCLEIEDARREAKRRGTAALLGGERGGRAIEGFDLGNSPEEYSPARVAGKTIVMTTTNGTRAMLRCRQARRVLIGAFVNFSAICEALRDEAGVDLLCAGTDNQVTREDVLFAGAVVDDLVQTMAAAGATGGALELNDQGLIALDAWRAAREDMRQSAALVDKLRTSHGGRNLIDIGHDRDIDIAADIDRFSIAPELQLTSWEIR
jgi:2-phosphosulfolactate phosphatase